LDKETENLLAGINSDYFQNALKIYNSAEELIRQLS